LGLAVCAREVLSDRRMKCGYGTVEEPARFPDGVVNRSSIGRCFGWVNDRLYEATTPVGRVAVAIDLRRAARESGVDLLETAEAVLSLVIGAEMRVDVLVRRRCRRVGERVRRTEALDHPLGMRHGFAQLRVLLDGGARHRRV